MSDDARKRPESGKDTAAFLEATAALLEDLGSIEKATQVVSAFHAFRLNKELQEMEEFRPSNANRGEYGAYWISGAVQMDPHAVAVLLRALAALSPRPSKRCIPFWDPAVEDIEYTTAQVIGVAKGWFSQASKNSRAVAAFIAMGGFDAIVHHILFPPHVSKDVLRALLALAVDLTATQAGGNLLRELRHEPQLSLPSFPYDALCDTKKLPAMLPPGSPLELLCSLATAVSVAAPESLLRGWANKLLSAILVQDKLTRFPLEALDGQWLPAMVEDEERFLQAPERVPLRIPLDLTKVLQKLMDWGKVPPELCVRLLTLNMHDIDHCARHLDWHLGDFLSRWPDFAAEHLAAHRFPFLSQLPVGSPHDNDIPTRTGGTDAVRGKLPPIHTIGLVHLLAAFRLKEEGRSSPHLQILASGLDWFRYRLEERFSEPEMALLSPPAVAREWAAALGLPRGTLESAITLLPKLARAKPRQEKKAAQIALTADNSLACSNPDCKASTHSATEFMRCAGCKRVRYCSKECQRAHWKAHKSTCKLWKTSSA